MLESVPHQRDERVLLGVLVEPRLKQQIIACAKKADRTISAEVRTALREHVAQLAETA